MGKADKVAGAVPERSEKPPKAEKKASNTAPTSNITNKKKKAASTDEPFWKKFTDVFSSNEAE